MVEVVTIGAVVTKYMVASNVYIKLVIFKPCVLQKIHIQAFNFQQGNEMFKSGCVPWLVT